MCKKHDKYQTPTRRCIYAHARYQCGRTDDRWQLQRVAGSLNACFNNVFEMRPGLQQSSDCKSSSADWCTVICIKPGGARAGAEDDRVKVYNLFSPRYTAVTTTAIRAATYEVVKKLIGRRLSVFSRYWLCGARNVAGLRGGAPEDGGNKKKFPINVTAAIHPTKSTVESHNRKNVRRGESSVRRNELCSPSAINQKPKQKARISSSK